MIAIGSSLVQTGTAMLLMAVFPATPVMAQPIGVPVDTGPEVLEPQDSEAGSAIRSSIDPPPAPEAGMPAETEKAPFLHTEEVAPPASADAQPVVTLPPLPAPDITVTESQLLLTLIDAEGIETTAPGNAVPYIVGRSCYSWMVKFDPVEGDLILSEELRLPGPARNWGTQGGATEVNAQRSGAITRRHADAARGFATAGWCVARDDPVGSYRYIIRQGDREIARFDFTVGDLL